MRPIPASLAAELASGATTLCRCWKAVRRDGQSFGFTDHDRDLAFDSMTFKAASGLEASEAESLLGFATGGGEIAGALQADAIHEADIDNGLWDGAAIETWLVDWRDVARRMLLDAGQIGDIRRRGEAFTAEVRSLAQNFDRERGRRYEALCSAELGDARCGVVLANATRRASVTIASVSDAGAFSAAALPGFAAGAFTGGTVAFTSGGNSGQTFAVMSHTRLGTQEVIALWSPPAAPLLAGDAVTLTVGCDKRFDTCRDRFANAANFRGFPHTPGNDFVVGYAVSGEAGLDGGTLTP
jgi:uncharacterized phage protein (TIGR02218 family)